MKYKLACLIILLVILIRPIKILNEQKEKFFSSGYQKQYEALKNSYDTSQYVQKKTPQIIPDEIFESFAAGAFLRGLNPILIVHDHPPLGRYILALSIVLFDNVSTLIPIILFFSGLGVFLIGRLVLKNTILALIPLGIFINEPLFLNKLYYFPLLEPIQLPFIIFAIYFFIKSIDAKKYLWWFLMVGIMLGFVISIRFFILGLVEYASMMFYLCIKYRFNRKVISFFFIIPIMLFILLLSYTRTFQSGYSLLSVIGIQKYIFFYHKSKFIELFSFWDLFFFNRWHTWWGNKAIISDTHWIIVWPVTYFVTLLSVFAALRKKIIFYDPEIVLTLWIFVYSSMLSAGYISTRYFMPLTPFLYILTVSFLKRIIKRLKKNRKMMKKILSVNSLLPLKII